MRNALLEFELAISLFAFSLNLPLPPYQFSTAAAT